MDITIEQAIKYLSESTTDYDSEFTDLHNQSIGKAIQALEKQVAISILGLELTEGIRIGNKIIREGCKIYKCKCGTPVSQINKYCSECGQRLEFI